MRTEPDRSEALATARNITIKDIASTLGISHSTVSRALADSPLVSAETKERIRTAAAEHGYVPNTAARIMRGAPSGLVGLLVPDVQSHFFSSLVKQFATSCSEAGLSLLLALSNHEPDTEERAIRVFHEARVLGIAVLPTKELTRHSQLLLNSGRTVQVGRRHDDLIAPFVSSEDESSMTELVRHLLELGHDRIGYIGPDPSTQPGLPRWTAFERTLREARVRFRPELRQIASRLAGGGRPAMEALLALKTRPTAIVVASAPLMPGVIEAAQRAGLTVPADFSLVGFGDPEWFAIWSHGITTAEHSTAEIARAALGILTNDATQVPPLLRGGEVLVPNTMSWRGTTQAKSASKALRLTPRLSR